jgi:hypothetical protein
MSLSKEQIDQLGKRYEDVCSTIDQAKAEKKKLEQELNIEFDERSESVWASKLIGNELVISRGSQKVIKPDDLRGSVGEWVEPGELAAMITPEHTEIKTIPEKVSLLEVNKVLSPLPSVADAINKVTTKIGTKITISNKEELL